VNILHFNTATEGGAAVLMQRLHESLKTSGVDSQIYYRKGQLPLANSKPLEFVHYRSGQWQERVMRRLESELLQRKDNLFSPLQSIVKTPLPPTLATADIYHLHWVSRWLDLPSFLHSLPPTAPIVLTLHDLGNLTGGCHLYSGCHGFETTCQPCPLLKFPFNRFLAHQELQRKQRWFSSRPVHVVGNSNWTTGLAKASTAFHGVQSFHTIYPALDTRTFIRHDKAAAKQLLGIPPDQLVLGFGCAELTDGNKNLGLFLQLLQTLKLSLDLHAVIFGNGLQLNGAPPVPIHNLGKLASSHLLSLAYSAMDLFIITSKTETFGMVTLEAQACGTPVCGFGVGGLTDAVQSGQTGYLVPFGDLDSLTAQVLALLQDPERRQRFGQTAHDWVRSTFSLEQMLAAYLHLYTEALA
jgi:glycosyltransferase involved in cell wall biosynthesis